MRRGEKSVSATVTGQKALQRPHELQRSMPVFSMSAFKG
jgi:hypothetical protein